MTLKRLITDKKWGWSTPDQICYKIPQGQTVAFEALVRDSHFISKLKTARKLFAVLSTFVHFLETPGCRASFSCPLFCALVQDINVWTSMLATVEFQEETCLAVMQAVNDRWMGDRSRNVVGLHGSQHLMAVMVDPGMCPDKEGLQDDWKHETNGIIKRFYPEPDDAQAARTELGHIVLHHGSFGKEVGECRAALEKASGNPVADNTMEHVAREIRKLKAALDLSPSNSWKTHINRQCPKLEDIAIRLLEMGTQSADVERVCKAHKVVQTKARDRLVNKNVKMLLHCCVNMHLMKRCETTGGTFVDNEPDLTEEFLDQALLDELSDAPTQATPTAASTDSESSQ